MRWDADVHSASDEYLSRFNGEVGQWFLKVQYEKVRTLLQDLPPTSTILDVGGGHGQLALPLAHAGYKVTVLASSPAGGKQVDQAVEAGKVTLEIGDLLSLPYPDNSFDAVISIRMMAHCPSWKIFLSELCRASRSLILIDYPTLQSVNKLSSLFFSMKKRIEHNTRDYLLFSEKEILSAFTEKGITHVNRAPQFLFPMALHRGLKTALLSEMVEKMSEQIGLTRKFGSPVLLVAKKKVH